MWFSEYTLHCKSEEWKTTPNESTSRKGDELTNNYMGINLLI
jgi:hypothetical protein